MDIDSRFEEIQDALREELKSTGVNIRRADDTLVFWKDEDRVGLEIPKSDIRTFCEYFERTTPEGEDAWSRVVSKVKQDTYHYLVLKYL